MKYFSFVVIFLFLGWSGQGQVIENQTFEQADSTSSSQLKGWGSNKFYETGRDTHTHFSGNASLYIKSIAGQKFGATYQIIALPPSTSMRKFRVSGHLKRDSVERCAGIWIDVFAGKNSLFFDNMANRQLNGTADWVEVTTDFYADPTATEVHLGGLLIGAGKVWFDDFSIIELPLGASSLPDSLHTYLDQALKIIQKNALYRDSADWKSVREQAFLMASGAGSYAACYPVIRYALSKLGDHHSFLMEASASKQWTEPDPDAYKKMPLTTGELLDGEIAYLRMPSVSSGNEQGNTYFADRLHHLIDSLDQYAPQGWIVDLRGNSGGNCWPMLAGIGPVLGEGVCGYFMTPGKAVSKGWTYRKGKSGIGRSAITKVSGKPYKLRKPFPPVAVLTGPRTASSGEIVTVAFRKRPNTRSFGEPTAGLSTANQNYSLRDGAQIFLTVSIYADRAREVYGSKITPDELVSLSIKPGSDAVLDSAKTWLAGLQGMK
jgi:hypothetical protein